MADVFLSYKREDHARAELIVDRLRSAGRTVWWDQGLTPRQAWDATIEQEIEAARKVVVLWSPRSTGSDWVRTEAHYAQNHGKLVPVVIEPCTIPLAFMLKQAIDLSGWHGSPGDPAWQKLLDWLDGSSEPEAASKSSVAAKPMWRRLPALRVAALLAIAIAALLAFLLFHRMGDQPAGAPSIHIARFEMPAGDQAAIAFSQGFAADLAQVAVAGGSKLRVIDDTNKTSASRDPSDFILNGSVRSAAGSLHASLTLNSAMDGAIIWSTSLTRPIAQVDAMHHEAEVRMGAVFVCALDEKTRERTVVSLDALKLYLQACEALPSGDDLQTRKLLRDVVKLAPGFAQAWGTLAEWNGFIVGSADDGAPDAHKEALAASARALAIDPSNSAAWVARAMVKTRMSEWSSAQRDLDQALALNPDDPIGNYFYASNLINVGRVEEALDYAEKAANSGPQFWPKTLLVIELLADLNRVDEAQAMMASALRTWPDNDALKFFALNLATQYADPRRAAATLNNPEIMAGQDPAHVNLRKLEVAVRANPTPATVDKAVSAINALFGASAQGAMGAAVNLIVIGRIDDAYSRLQAQPVSMRNAPYVSNPSVFFHLYAGKFRADPRFMGLARGLGLVAIWQHTKWPDFCRGSDAPYDCAALAKMR